MTMLRVLLATMAAGAVALSTAVAPAQAFSTDVTRRAPGGAGTAVLKAASAAGTDLRVASFNVMTVSGDRTEGDQLPWAKRRATVIGQILSERVDIIGVQEVNQSSIWASRLVDGPNQYLDLKNGLNKAGGTFALTNEYAYNCVDPRSTHNCVPQYRGAAGDNRIYYNTSKLAMESAGSYRFKAQPSTAAPAGGAILAYAVMRVKATGKRFLFTNAHLDPRDPALRMAQWRELITKVNALKGTLPVVNVGDYNLQKFDPDIRTLLPAMKAAGYGDVLNQTYATNPVVAPRAQRTVNAWINSLGRYQRDVSAYGYETRRDKTGNSIDWIFASNALPVKEFKLVLKYDPTTLRVIGTIPSDHNMIRATLSLP